MKISFPQGSGAVLFISYINNITRLILIYEKYTILLNYIYDMQASDQANPLYWLYR